MRDRSPTCLKQHVFLCSRVSTVQFMQTSSSLTTVQESARVACWADWAAPPVPPSEQQNIGENVTQKGDQRQDESPSKFVLSEIAFMAQITKNPRRPLCTTYRYHMCLHFTYFHHIM